VQNGHSNGSVGPADGDLQLNERALEVAHELLDAEDGYNIVVREVGQVNVIDVGVETPGSLMAGRYVAEICMSDLGGCSVQLDRLAGRPCPRVTVDTESPTAACLLSQYAGWKIVDKGFFAMGSGPIRALVGEEELFRKLQYREASEVGVLVLETSTLPNAAVIKKIASAAHIKRDGLIVVAARTASITGSFQVVARSVETCMHKLFELGFEVDRVRSAFGSAYLPPIPNDDLVAIGRTNDSILYGAEVCLWVDCDDEAIRAVGDRLPAKASADYGRPFAEIFDRAGGDFYKIDPLLFSPALVFVNNLRTGSTFAYGEVNHELLAKSFFGG
jgi:methenyltetrahydromethanopterin cyclohydrolase